MEYEVGVTEIALEFANLMGFKNITLNTDEVLELAEEWLGSFNKEVKNYIGMTLYTSKPKCCVVSYDNEKDVEGYGDSLATAIMQAVIKTSKEI